MASQPHPSPLVAVDSNVPLDLADGNESVLDALNTIRGRLSNARFVVTPSVFQELVHVALEDSVAARRALGQSALRQLKEWQFDLLEIVPVGHGIVESIAQRLRAAGLLPEEEVHDSLILAEAALLGCAVLLTSDAHLRGLDYARLTWELNACDVSVPVIATPREIVSKFFR
jgi:predicted nucleic acid-binding protein